MPEAVYAVLKARHGSASGSDPQRGLGAIFRDAGMRRSEDRLMAWPRVLVIEDSTGGAILHGYAADGSPVVNTWHENAVEAQARAGFEYHVESSDWATIPDGQDHVEYALEQARTRDLGAS